MPADLPSSQPLHPGEEGLSHPSVEPSREASDYLSLRDAALAAGCSESTVRRLIKASEIPFVQEDTQAGFRYLVRTLDIPVIAHKASMRRPRGRMAGGHTLQPSNMGTLQEAMQTREELAAVKTERDLLRSENQRLWTQVERLTESVTRLALPERRIAEAPGEASTSGSWGRFWDWFLGRGGGEAF
jgi:hypothetical protein